MKSDGVGSEKLSCFYTLKWSPFMIVMYQVRCMNVCCGFPCVVAFGVSFPLDQILKDPVLPKVSVIAYLLHFVLRFIINQVRRRSGEVGPMCGHFAIG